jgi:hypothetical protein
MTAIIRGGYTSTDPLKSSMSLRKRYDFNYKAMSLARLSTMLRRSCQCIHVYPNTHEESFLCCLLVSCPVVALTIVFWPATAVWLMEVHNRFAGLSASLDQQDHPQNMDTLNRLCSVTFLQTVIFTDDLSILDVWVYCWLGLNVTVTDQMSLLVCMLSVQ